MFTSNYKNMMNRNVYSPSYSSGSYTYYAPAITASVKDVNGNTHIRIYGQRGMNGNLSAYVGFFNAILFRTIQSSQYSPSTYRSCYMSSYSENDYALQPQLGSIAASSIPDSTHIAVTVSNNETSDITINTIQWAVKFYDDIQSQSSSNYYNFLLAEFELGDTIIPPGESKTWVIKPMFDAVSAN